MVAELAKSDVLMILISVACILLCILVVIGAKR